MIAIRNNRISALLLLAAALLLASCLKEREALVPGVAGGEAAALRLTVPAVRAGGTDGTAEDNAIRDLRVLVYRVPGGRLAYHAYVPDLGASGADPLTIAMTTGTYDFVFIANESSDAALSARLQAFAPGSSVLSDLDGESFAASAFAADKPIPMTSLYRGVTVTGDRSLTYTPPGASAPVSVSGADWPVEVVRLGIRLDLSLRTPIGGIRDAARTIAISNVPSRVFLFDTQVSGAAHPNNTEATGGPYAAPRTFAIGAPNGDFESDAPNGYLWTAPRIVLPENRFDPVFQPDRAYVLTVGFDDWRGPMSTTFGIGDGSAAHPDDHTAPRNYIFRMTGRLNDAIEFDGAVTPWEETRRPGEDLTDPVDLLPEANSYIVAPASDPIGIPISRANDARALALLALSSPQLTAADGVAGLIRAELVWSDQAGIAGKGLGAGTPVRAVRAVIDRRDFARSYLLVTPGEVQGNAVVAVYKDNNGNGRYDSGDRIAWSWHIWVTDYRPGDDVRQEIPWPAAWTSAWVGGGLVYRYRSASGADNLFMDRNLGAVGVQTDDVSRTILADTDERALATYGLYYQWGRKDPFPGPATVSGTGQSALKTLYGTDGPVARDVAPVTAVNNAPGAVANPVTMYYSASAGDWYTSDVTGYNDALWTVSGQRKSVFDPCPPGWRVPDAASAVWGGLSVPGSWTCGYLFPAAGYFPAAGQLVPQTGMGLTGSEGSYPGSGAFSGAGVLPMSFRSGSLGFTVGTDRQTALPVRCVRDKNGL